MFWTTIAAAIQLAQAPAQVAYVPVAGGAFHRIAPVEALLAGEAGLRRSAADGAPFAACLQRFPYVDHANTCLRAALPRTDGGAPLVTIYVEEVRRSNVTGSRVNKTLTIWCVGQRAVGRAELAGTLDAPHEVETARAPARQCVADALRVAAGATIDEATGAASWRFAPGEGGLIRDQPLARGNARERAIVTVRETWSKGEARRGDCTLAAQVERVLGGSRLRAGDMIALPVPCGTNGVADGMPAHLFVGYGGELRYFEPL
jgi:hypothetical protein